MTTYDKLPQKFRILCYLAQIRVLTARKRSIIVDTRHVFCSQNYQKCFCGRSSTPNFVGEITARPRPSSWISERGEGKGREKWEERKERISVEGKEKDDVCICLLFILSLSVCHFTVLVNKLVQKKGTGRTGRKGRGEGGLPLYSKTC